MPNIVFVDHKGSEREIEASVGETLMLTAIKHSVPGIDADCGGACACATCHVFVDPAYLDMLQEPGDMEKAMLEFAENVQTNSRLSCQIKILDNLEGMRITTPQNQQ
jgi:2Fe-2S ferredoxin